MGEEKRKRKKKVDPPSAVGGLKVIDKRVGSWGKKKRKRKKKVDPPSAVGGLEGI